MPDEWQLCEHLVDATEERGAHGQAEDLCDGATPPSCRSVPRLRIRSPLQTIPPAIHDAALVLTQNPTCQRLYDIQHAPELAEQRMPPTSVAM
jgi:hypothetical protein